MNGQRLAGTGWVAAAVVLATLSGCTSGGSSPGTTPAKSPTGSATPCQPAPPALVSFLEGGLSVRGATLSHGVVVPATGLDRSSAGLPPSFAAAWWVGARITGAGVRPELIVWLVSSLAPRTADQVVAANATARRDSPWSPADGKDISGPGLADVAGCVGPMPAP